MFLRGTSGTERYVPKLETSECYAYHPAGAVTEKQINWVPSNWYSSNITATYGYDSEGRLSTVAFPSGGSSPTADSISYAYDSLGRLSTMTDTTASTALVSATSYNVANQLTSMTASTFSETRGYNANMQLTQITAGTVSPTTTLQRRTTVEFNR